MNMMKDSKNETGGKVVTPTPLMFCFAMLLYVV